MKNILCGDDDSLNDKAGRTHTYHYIFDITKHHTIQHKMCYYTQTMLCSTSNCEQLSKYIINKHMCVVDEEEDVSCYWMTLRNGEDTVY